MNHVLSTLWERIRLALGGDVLATSTDQPQPPLNIAMDDGNNASSGFDPMNYSCPICQDLLRCPIVQTKSCGRRFCRECIMKVR